MLQAGSASTIITNELGTDIQGATVGGKAKYIRDELEAGGLCLVDDNTAVMFVSCDLGGLEPEFTQDARESMAKASGLDPRAIIIGATHTGGPSVIPSNYVKPVDSAYLAKLKESLTVLAGHTMNSLKPARIGVAGGHAKIGYNRRTCWSDGSHQMGPNSDGHDFTGLEGPEDHEQLVIYAVDDDNRVTAVLHQNTAHPCTFYGADFYSADYPGLARKLIRDAVGDIPVLFFNGAFGDIGQDTLDGHGIGMDKEMKLGRCALPLAGETLRLIYETAPLEQVSIEHVYEDIEVAVRLPSAERLKWAGEVLEHVDAGEQIPPFEIVSAHGAALLQKRFGDNPVGKLPIHVVRIGPAAVVTQPTELFCQFGLDIKRRSPFPLTAVFSICDGYSGYCPTYPAVISGGYSGEPIYWTRFVPEAGYRIVDASSRLLRQLRKDD
ncbi:MAG: hypothetical protein K9N51_01185 [Candidatus Pacebacteria bacterium]|nr:hypothetical protein [Candidatus Paceibacterota bacterium]